MCTVTNQNEPICACKPGYVEVDKFGCVDESPPLLKLRHDTKGDGITRLKQGDSYKEYAVDVMDDNAEDYLRSLKIAYSRPLPPGCLVEMGAFQVNYTVAMPWANPPYARVTRDVLIEDIDECRLDVERYETQCPQLIPQCDIDAGAVCQNTKGSYTCQCPKYTSGDGFKFISSVQSKDGTFVGGPLGYNGGTGCRDTSKPVIRLVGPNPKVFRTFKSGGLTGIMESTKKRSEKDEKMLGEQRERYEEDIAKMIKDTAAAELCASHTKKNPLPVHCVKATDITYKANIDVSAKVTVGTPVQVSDLEWKVPYNVMDDAGNAADTVWRRIVVEEVDMAEMEQRIRKEILADREKEIEEAVRVAVEQERQKTPVVSNSRQQQKNASCPKCPACECPTDGKGLSLAECGKVCEEKVQSMIGTCDPGSEHHHRDSEGGSTLMHSFLDNFIDLTEGVLSPNFAGIVLLGSIFAFAIFILQRILAVNQSGWQYYDPQDEQREREMMNQVTYFNGQGRNEMRSPSYVPPSGNTGNVAFGGSPPPRTSMASGTGSRGGMFSPPEENQYVQANDGIFSPGGSSIYQDTSRNSFMSPITPSGNVHQQPAARENATPYNLRKRY